LSDETDGALAPEEAIEPDDIIDPPDGTPVRNWPGARSGQVIWHSGPVPSADWLERVEALSPGSTQLILSDYLQQRQHTRELAEKALTEDSRAFDKFAQYQLRQLHIAGGIAVLILVAGLVLLFAGRAVEGFVLLVIEAGVVAGTFLANQVRSGSDSSENSEEEPVELDGPGDAQ